MTKIMVNGDFIALILSHGRANNVITYKTLRKYGYTGPIRIVIDDEDDQADEYYKRFPGEVVRFHKAGVKCQTYDNRKERRVILFARNAAFDVAEQLGYRYFIQLDDDYTNFSHKFTPQLEYKSKCDIKDLDGVFDAMLDFYKANPSIKTIALAQNGDFIGGGGSGRADAVKLWRKAMNSFICDTQRRFEFEGRINEDVNTYTLHGSRGELFFTLNSVALNQKETQRNKGGMTGAYLDGGTYIKSFYSVIGMPSAVKVGMMGYKNYRLHHLVSWNNCVPKILNEKYRKP